MKNLTDFYLRKLQLSDEKIVEDYLFELIRSGSSIKGFLYEDGKTFLETFNNLKRKENVAFTSYNQADFPCIQYLLIRKEDEKMVGAVNVRPFLTEELDKGFEGNIGYSISPGERGKGYGHIALALAIEEYKKLNANNDIIMCCYKENLPSKNIIIKAGGVLIEEEQGILIAQKYLIKR